MKNKPYMAYAVCILIGCAIGAFCRPARIQIKEVEKVVKQESEKTNEDKRTIKVVRETIRPDGTIIKETRQERESSTQTESESFQQTEKLKEEIRENRASYRVGVVYQPDLPNIQNDNYSLVLEKRLFSEVYVGVQVGLDKTIGLSLSLGF